MNRSSLAAFSLFAAGLFAAAAPSQAYRMIQNKSTGRVAAGNLVSCDASGGFLHWNITNMSWYLDPGRQGAGKAGALTTAMASWTNVTGADYVLTYAGTTTSGWVTDGRNTVLFGRGNGCTGNCLAITALVIKTGQVIVETDISFNSDYTWSTNGFGYDVQAVATHEFGHSLGIHHTQVTSFPRPTMYATYNGTDGRTLESDDRKALQCAQSRYPVPGGNLYTVPPCRAIDTRSAKGPFGGPALAGNKERAFTLAGRCGIPESAKAVAVNVSVLSPTAMGYLTLFPGGITRPNTSTLNYSPARNRSNDMILPLGQGASFTAFSSLGTTHLVLDVAGYFD